MLGSIIGAGLGVAGSVFGGIAASKAARKQARILADEKKKNEAWYNRRYNEDSTQRADAQSALNRMREVMQERSQRSAGTAAVMGTGEEAAAAEKEAQNNALAATTSNIAAQGEARKDAVESQYLQRDQDLSNQQQQVQAQKTAAISQAIGGIASAAGGMASNLDLISSMPKK